MIRFLRYALGWIVYMGWWGSGVVVSALVGVRYRPGNIYDRSGREWGRGMLRFCRITVRVASRERIPAGSAVFMSNHASQIDIWALLALLPGSVRFVFKKRMVWIPLMGLAMRRGQAHPDRSQVQSRAFCSYDEAAKPIQGGISAVVFAEGTRSRDGRLKPFKRGPFVLAIAAGAPVVPVFCDDTYERMPKGSIGPRAGPITMQIGSPIPTRGMAYEDRDQVSEAARRAVIELGAEPV